MSKLFSISMATVLMLMSLVGPMEPASVDGDAPQDVNPMAEELPLDDASDGEEVLVEEQIPVELPPVVDEEVATEDEALTPVEEPAENANAPPAGEAPVVEDEPVVDESEVEKPVVVPDEEQPVVEEDSVVEEAAPVMDDEPVVLEVTNEGQADEGSETESDNLISPSAVDPNPGDCPVDEICDGGGGGEDPEIVTVTITITQSTVLSDGATVVVKTSGNAEVGTKVTGASGIVEFELTAGETYLVDVSKAGWVSRTGVSLTVSDDSRALAINLLPVYGKVTITVTDAVTGDPVRYATVRFTGKSGTNFNVNKNSGGTGQISTSMDSGEYVAFFSHSDYVSQRFDVTITVGDSVSVQLVPEAVEPEPNVLSLEIVDKATGDPIPNAQVILRTTTGQDVVAQGTTDANGRWDSSPLEDIDYGLTILSPFHKLYLETITSIPPSVWTIELDSGPELTATFTILDIETDEPIENAFISVKDHNSDTEVAAGQTDASGTWTYNPTLTRGHWITIAKDGYQDYLFYQYVDGDYSRTVRLMPPGYPGSITFAVGDADVNLDIPGATITVSNGEVTETVITDESGRANLDSIPSGTYDLTIEANGYETYVGTVAISPNNSLQGTYGLEPRPAATLDIQLQAPVAGAPIVLTNMTAAASGFSSPVLHQVPTAYQPIAGQRIQVVNPETGLVMVDGVTDADGAVSLSVARQGTYHLNVSVDGYEAYSAPYELTQDSSHVITLQPIVVDTPDDPDSGTPDDGTSPGSDNPDEGTTPGTDTTPDDGTNPGSDNPDEGTTPGTGTTPDAGAPDTSAPDSGTPPDASSPDTGTTPDAGGEESSEVTDPIDDNDVAASVGSAPDGEAVARSAGSSSDSTSGSVNGLPNTGIGESQSHVGIVALTLVAAFTLLGALGVRRRV